MTKRTAYTPNPYPRPGPKTDPTFTRDELIGYLEYDDETIAALARQNLSLLDQAEAADGMLCVNSSDRADDRSDKQEAERGRCLGPMLLGNPDSIMPLSSCETMVKPEDVTALARAVCSLESALAQERAEHDKTVGVLREFLEHGRFPFDDLRARLQAHKKARGE